VAAQDRRRAADVAAGVLLISTDFLTSNVIKTAEVPKLLERPVYPILVGYCAPSR
jgi:hypothetical protein